MQNADRESSKLGERNEGGGSSVFPHSLQFFIIELTQVRRGLSYNRCHKFSRPSNRNRKKELAENIMDVDHEVKADAAKEVEENVPAVAEDSDSNEDLKKQQEEDDEDIDPVELYPVREFHINAFKDPISFNPLVSAIGCLCLWGLSIWCMGTLPRVFLCMLRRKSKKNALVNRRVACSASCFVSVLPRGGWTRLNIGSLTPFSSVLSRLSFFRT